MALDKIVSLFKINTPKQPVYGTRRKPSKPKTKNVRKPFILVENKKIKDRIMKQKNKK